MGCPQTKALSSIATRSASRENLVGPAPSAPPLFDRDMERDSYVYVPERTSTVRNGKNKLPVNQMMKPLGIIRVGEYELYLDDLADDAARAVSSHANNLWTAVHQGSMGMYASEAAAKDAWLDRQTR